MPRTKSGTFDQSRYVQQYIKENTTIKKVMFNKKEEAELLAWAEGIPGGFSGYVKRLIRDDMTARK